jgi:hypothetical protein
MTQEKKSELRSLLFNEHRIVDFSSDNPFVGIYFNDLVDIIDSMLKKDKEGDSKYETKSLEALATLKSILETEDADLIMTRYDQNRTMELTPDSVRDFFYGESVESDVVDLGLPSGTLWAKYNLGAEKETDFGRFFQWGDTQGYKDASEHQFKRNDYKWEIPLSITKAKYNNTDGKLVLDNEDDPVFVATNGKQKMPTKEQIQELIDHTDHRWTNIDGVKGMKFINKNDDTKYIFIPAAGYCYHGSLYGVGSFGCVWSASRNESNANLAWRMSFYAGNVDVDVDYSGRYLGCSVRGVINPKPIKE